MPAVRQRRNNPPDTPGGRHAECCMPLRVRNQRSAGPLPDDSRKAVCPAPKEPPVGREGPFGVRPFHASSTGPNPCWPLLMRDAPLFQYLFISGKRCSSYHVPWALSMPNSPRQAVRGKRQSGSLAQGAAQRVEKVADATFSRKQIRWTERVARICKELILQAKSTTREAGKAGLHEEKSEGLRPLRHLLKVF